MRVTIIPSDNKVIIGEKSIKFDLSSFEVDPNYHAIQWDGEKGFIETKEGKDIKLTSLDEFQPLLDEHANLVAAEAALLEAEEEASIPLHKKVYRDQRENAGVIFNNKTIQTDLTSRTNMIGVYAFAQNNSGFQTTWRASDNTWLALTNAEIIQLCELALGHVQKCFIAHQMIEGNVYETKEAIEQAFDAAYDSL